MALHLTFLPWNAGSGKGTHIPLSLCSGSGSSGNRCTAEWVIPENIHTIPQVASWNSEGEGGFLGLEFRRHGGGVMQFGILKAWGGCSSSEFSEFPEERR